MLFGRRGQRRRGRQRRFCDAQAGQYNLTATSDNKQTIGRLPAGVSVANANHVHFERNIFTQMGATGLDFVSGYTIAHNAMVYAPANVAQNQTGQNTITDTPAANAQSVNAMAGID